MPKQIKKNNLESVWQEAKGEHDLCDITYSHVTSQMDNESAKRLYDIKLYFYRGIFEGASEKVGISKKDFRKSVIYCYRKRWDKEGYEDIEDSKKDSMAKQSFEATEDGLKYDDSIGEMSKDIINKGKKSFKTNQGGAGMTALVKLWKDKTIDFSESPIEKNVKNFFRKIF